MDLVSIAIPAYKTTFLKQCIDSILNQSYANFELIIVDDCSPNPVKEIVYSFNDPRIRYFRNKENLGKKDPSKNWNQCLEYANGEFFSLLCDDDTYEPTFIEEMLSLAKKNPQHDVFRARVNVINESGTCTDIYPSSPFFETYDDYLWQKINGFRKQTISEFFLHTKCIKELNGYQNMPMAWGSDVLSILKFSKNLGIIHNNKALVNFRMSVENISAETNINIKEKFVAQNLFYEEIKKICEEIPNRIIKEKVRNKLPYIYNQDFAYLFSLCSIIDMVWVFRTQKLSLTLLLKCLLQKAIHAFVKK